MLGRCLRHVLDMPYIKPADIHTHRMVTNTNANQSMYQKSTQETNTARSLTERAGEVSLVDGIHHRAQARLELLFCCMWFGCMAWGERLTVRCGDTSRGTYNPPKSAWGIEKATTTDRHTRTNQAHGSAMHVPGESARGPRGGSSRGRPSPGRPTATLFCLFCVFVVVFVGEVGVRWVVGIDVCTLPPPAYAHTQAHTHKRTT